MPERSAPISPRSALTDTGETVAGGGGRARGVAAVALALVGAAAVSAAPVLGVIRTGGALAGNGAAAAFAAVLVLATPILALTALMLRRNALSGGLLVGAGAVSVGSAVLDLQLWTDAIDANRLELFRPRTAESLTAGPGAYVIVGGHILIAVAGLLGVLLIHRASLLDGYGHARNPEQWGRATGARIGFFASASAVLAAATLAAALFAPALRSEDPVILVPAVVDAGAATSVGAAFVAVAVLIVVASALASIAPLVASGAVIGAALSALGLAGTQLVAGLTAGERIEPGVGAVVAVVAACALLAAGLVIPIADRVRGERALRELMSAAPTSGAVGATGKGRVATPSAKGVAKAAMRAQAVAARARLQRWHVVTASAGIVTGVLAGLGALLPTVILPAGGEHPHIYATRVVLIAALVLIVASIWLLFSEFAAAVRPAVAVLWVAVVTSVAGVTQSVVLATDVPGVGPGLGALVMWISVVPATATGLFAWFAGSAERDDIDTSGEPEVDTVVLLVGGLGAVAAAVGFGLPLFRGVDGAGVDYAATGLGEFPWGIDAWGQALAAAAVVVAVAVAARARPARGRALFVGSAVVVGIYLLGWPLTGPRVEAVVVGPGVLPSTVGIVLLMAAAGLTMRAEDR